MPPSLTLSPALSPTLRRAAALLLPLAVLALPHVLVVEPLLATWRRSTDAAADAREALIRYRSLAAGRTDLEQRVATVRQRSATRKDTLDAASDALAAAILQTRLKTMLATVGADLKSTQPLPSRADGSGGTGGDTAGDLRRVGIRIQAAVRVSRLADLLHGLETAAPVRLFLDNVDIRRPGGAAAADSALEDPPLDIHLDVYGYREGANP